MQLKAPCPKCGKRARYTEAEAGLPAVCNACGSRFRLPELAPPAIEDIPLAIPVEETAAPHRAWVWAALGGGIVLGVVVAIGAVALLSHRGGQTTVATPTETEPTAPASSHVSSENPISESPTPAPAPPVEAPLPPAATSEPTSSQPLSVGPDNGPQNPAPMPSLLPSPTSPAATSPAAIALGRPPIVPIADPPAAVTDERIGRAITAGVAYLVAHIDPVTHELRQNGVEGGGRFGGGQIPTGAFYGGLDALCVYALMQSGEAIPDKTLDIKSPYITGLIEQMKKMPDADGPATYAHALRATALALFNRPEDKKTLRADFEWLLKAANHGAYTYDMPDAAQAADFRRFAPGFGGVGPDGIWDASNSQYGLLGVWSGAEAGLEVPTSYWKDVEDHWTQNQQSDGEWGYQGPSEGQGRQSMTSAGIASLFVTHDWLTAPRFGNDVGRQPFSPALSKGLEWFEQSNHSVDTSSALYWGYSLYGIERVGLASGFKYFGTHDWYRELTQLILDNQNANGSWGQQQLIDTPYVLLFLARGRHPVIMNKLRFDGFWANRPRDLFNLSAYMSEELERPLNWQIVPIEHEWTDWTDAPILYMASHKAPTLSDRDYDNIRSFINNGGLLFTQSDGSDANFDVFVAQMAHKLFPNYKLTDLPPDDPLYSVNYHLDPKPHLKVVSNGARPLIIHSPIDLARAWQLHMSKVAKMPFQFGLNLFVYATGKRELHNRLEAGYLTAVKATPKYTIHVARLSYNGNWDPEPSAWTRYSRWFQRQTGYGLDVSTVPMSELQPQTAPIAILTGTDAYTPTMPEILAVRNYVQAGGVLFVDLCGGAGAFEESARTKLFANSFPTGFLRVIPPEHPLLNTGKPGMEDLTHPHLRAFALEKLGISNDELPDSFTAGHGHVIFTPLDMTDGLLNINTWAIIGYDPAYAQAFIKNLLLWTVDGQKDE
jgi:hypothetical protein